jgi:hypothetical protein
MKSHPVFFFTATQKCLARMAWLLVASFPPCMMSRLAFARAHHVPEPVKTRKATAAGPLSPTQMLRRGRIQWDTFPTMKEQTKRERR